MTRAIIGMGLLIVLIFEYAPKSEAQISFHPYRYRPLFSGHLAHAFPILTVERTPQFGMNPFPFEQGRRQLNVPQIPRSSEPRREVIYIYPPAGAAQQFMGMSPQFTPFAQQTQWMRPTMIPPHLEPKPADAPDSTQLTLRFTDQLEEAAAHFRAERYEDAIQVFKSIRERVSGNAMVEMGYALALFADGRPHLAAQSLRRALTLHPVWFSQPVHLSAFYDDLEIFQTQWEELTLSLREEPDNKRLLFLASYLSYANDDLDAAHEYLKRLLEITPGDVEASALLGQIITKGGGS